MSDDNKLTDHNYDGIQELDNSLPRWWLVLFYFSIAFGIGYFVYYELGEGPSLQQEFEKDLAALNASKPAVVKTAFPDVSKLMAYQKNNDAPVKGKGVFATRCVSCHGEHGQGIIGPNLTDDYWLHGDGKAAAIAKVIYDGVLDKGMPPWGPLLTEEEVYSTAIYINSLKGTNPTAAKASQGQLIKE